MQKIAARLAGQRRWKPLERLAGEMCRRDLAAANGCQLWAYALIQQGAWQQALIAIKRAMAHWLPPQRLLHVYQWKLKAQIQRLDPKGAGQTLAAATKRFPHHPQWRHFGQQINALKAMADLAGPASQPASRPAPRP